MPEVESWDEATQTVVKRTLTEAEFIAEFGEEAWLDLSAPSVPPEDMTEGERYLANKMQVEQETSEALAAAGYGSIFDLPSEDDDESISLDDLVPQEYDGEGAAADLRAKEAREAAARNPDG